MESIKKTETMKSIKLLLFLIGMAVISSCSVNKMIKHYDEINFKTTPEVLQNHGDKIAVKVEGTIPEKYFASKASVEMKPTLQYEGGSVALKPFILKGEKAEGEGTVINKKTGGDFSFSDVINYTPEMENAVLVLEPTVKLKKKEATLGHTKLADGVIITNTRVKHNENTAFAADKYEKETIITKNGNIYFAQNQFNYNKWLPLNKDAASKQKLAEVKDFIRLGWEIKDIDIKAWASPEGEETFNKDLSTKRSERGMRYLKSTLHKLRKEKDSKVAYEKCDDLTINIQARGEDWNGFMKAVKESNINEKNTILNVVNSEADLTRREEEIRKMSLVYGEVANDILPKLRRVEIAINCFEPKFTDEQLADYAINNPEKLDKEEMLYAATLHTDNAKKIKIYSTAATTYKCSRAFNNLAACYIAEGDLNKAEKTLNKAQELKNSPEIINNLGVIASKKGDYTKAISLYKQAENKGLNTNYNMGICNIISGKYNAAKSDFNKTNCDYNVALLNILTENYKKAESLLKCSEKGAQEYYLLAVVGARTNNEAMVMQNLNKAFKEDASLKATALKDREFISFYKNADFINITK